MRPLSLVRQVPAGTWRQTGLQRVCKVRTAAIFTGSAFAFGEALAPRHGSSLLSLKLPFGFAVGRRSFRSRPPIRSFLRRLPTSRLLPAGSCLLRDSRCVAESLGQGFPCQIRSGVLVAVATVPTRALRSSPYRNFLGSITPTAAVSLQTEVRTASGRFLSSQTGKCDLPRRNL